MAHYHGVNGVAREVTKRYHGVDGIAREVTKAYHGVDGVARQYYSSEMVWKKYGCFTGYYTESYPSNHMSGGTWPISYGICDWLLGSWYSFSTYEGYYLGDSVSFELTETTTPSELNDSWVGAYIHISSTEIGCITNVNDVSPLGNGYEAYIEFEYEVVALATYTQSYQKDESRLYGTITVESGELPEEGTLIEGSPNEGYCVLQIGSTYYYYELE